MPGTSSDLAEWLLACIRADKEDLETSRIEDAPEWWMPAAWSRERGLAECEAKRRIIELHTPEGNVCSICFSHWEDWFYLDEPASSEFEPYPCPTLRALALPYSSHPDYRQEWRP